MNGINADMHVMLQRKKNEVNQATSFFGNWYPTARPLQIYRKVLNPGCFSIGTPLKLIKNSCNTCSGPVGSKHGNAISFSGKSGIRSATTNLSKTYYSDTAAYLRSRGQNYTSNVNIHPEEGVVYSNDRGPVWPETVQSGPYGPVNSSFYASNTPEPRCSPKLADEVGAVGAHPKPAIYKPNNVKFAKQGAVSSSTLMLQRATNATNMPQLSAYDKKKKLKLVKQPFWGTLG